MVQRCVCVTHGTSDSTPVRQGGATPAPVAASCMPVRVHAVVANNLLLRLLCSKGRRVDEVLKAILAAGEEHRRRISTATLNLVLREAVAWKAPPSQRGSGKQGRIYYATQAASKPPTFVLFVNDPRLFSEDYRRCGTCCWLVATYRRVRVLWRGVSLTSNHSHCALLLTCGAGTWSAT